MLVSLTAADFLRYITWGIFLIIGLWVIIQAIRHPTPVNIDVAFLFSGLSTAIVLTILVRLGLLANAEFLQSISRTAVFAMPFLLVRLIDDIVGVKPLMMRIFMSAFAVYIALAWLAPVEVLQQFIIVVLGGLLITLGYVVVSGLRAIRQTHGITRRRLIAVSLGSFFLALNFTAGNLPIDPQDARSLVDIFGAAAAISYYIGFVPPRWVRRLWQGPELRAFLARSAGLPQIPDPNTMLRTLEQGTAAALGAPYATIGLWDNGRQVIEFPTYDTNLKLDEHSEMPAARAFHMQQPIFSRDTSYPDEAGNEAYLRTIARVVLSAPITIGDQRLGVLSVYGPRVAVFADDDLVLLQLLADQTAVVLESRRLNERLARMRAREESTRLKDDFLSVAAHDLKTPLTTLVVQAQMAERRAQRDPTAPADLNGLRRIVSESERLRAMVLELLSAAQAEQQQLVGPREWLDLVEVVHTVLQRHENDQHTFVLDVPKQLVAQCDRRRIEQLLDNLIENAVTYSPDGGRITISLRQEETKVHLSVQDQGIGIPSDDLPYLFDRFHRGANVDDRRFPGWGLGLSICLRIVEQHGGQIKVNSREGHGSTFLISLPLLHPQAEPSALKEYYVSAHSHR